MTREQFIDQVEGCYGTYNDIQLGHVVEYIDRKTDKERDVLFELLLRTHKQSRPPFIGEFESLNAEVYETLRTGPKDPAPANALRIGDDAVDHREEVAELLSGLVAKLRGRGDV